ncbi:hypothetical protein WN944_005196 [Citrus x changshan-huyou]|uniref:Uncharacterized protein n=3 Tax=Citrus TaxID=2706 RepID=A0ACB8K3B3_CITSI|nr:uncharacterized protein LOC112498609 [Citrus sinensis]KAH9675602.1 hypothetical protein KPL70_018860 [Citrus sinensis]KAH9739174.1 hypothetical protein KPL71_019042 [Citrus sinensis]KDO63168.1 hypothetical protein CISIN_1g033100mg [Citrus sinensis]GAY43812.1 hypothetical protein CUMW_077450 [Citrus unshiu]
MAASLPHFNALIKPSFKRNTRRALQVMAHQSFRDEGRLSNNNIVDANLKVLRERIEKIQIKERLEKCCRCDQYGWNYSPGYDYKFKRAKDLRQFFEIVKLISGTICFTCLSGTAFLCLLSVLVHISQ